MLLLNLVLCLSVRIVACIVVICVALRFVLPDVHRVVASIQSAAPLFLMSACLAGAASSDIADGAAGGTNREPHRDRTL